MAELTELVEKFIDDVSTLRVAVVGETILDKFIQVEYEGQSMKSFCPVFRLSGSETITQEGGAGAIANHLRDFVASVEVVTNTDGEIVKTRYVDEKSGKKHIEINQFNTQKFGEILLDATKYDVVIVADFGHGFCDNLKITGNFHLMCQTNSNNFGFNRVSKWKTARKKSICIDLREASLQMNRRIKNPTDQQIVDLYNYEMDADLVFVTVGGSGSVFTDGRHVFRHKSYPTLISDTIGAGDAFFAFSSLVQSTSLDKKDYLTLPSLAASLTTTWLCNEQSVDKNKLRKHAAGYI